MESCLFAVLDPCCVFEHIKYYLKMAKYFKSLSPLFIKVKFTIVQGRLIYVIIINKNEPFVLAIVPQFNFFAKIFISSLDNTF